MTRSTQRTPEELAAFKAANLAAEIKATIIEPRKPDRRFTITWMTPAGNFGWTTVHADSIEEAAEAWFALRGSGRRHRHIPDTAEIELIKRGGQEI